MSTNVVSTEPAQKPRVRTMSTVARGFTLIELLIVVAIIAILAAIAVPNFLEAQTRAKVSRTKADMRSLVTATETYHIDHSNYPLPSDPEGAAIPSGSVPSWDWFETKTPVSLTTPVAYMNVRPGDPFARRGSNDAQNFHFTSTTYLRLAGLSDADHIYPEFYEELKGQHPAAAIGYIYLSFGPDADHDVGGEDDDHGGGHAGHSHGAGAIYDASNGTISSGDIHYVGPGPGFL